MLKLTRYHTVFRVTLVNSSVNTLLALLKIIIGYLGHSQALIADGIHSFSDLITDALVLIAARMGEQTPDKEHPYGHHRIETIGAIIISVILIAVAVGIAYDTLSHLIQRAHLIKPSYSVILVAAISIAANEGLYQYTLFQGNKINSDLLRTNAWHNRSDALVSLIVFISVIGTLFGVFYLDSLGALIIAILILKMGLKLIWNGIKELIDTGVDEQTFNQITNTILKVPGVLAIHQLRTRSHGGIIFIDVHIQVSPNISISEGHYISEQVHLQLTENSQNVSDVTVHIDPEDDQVAISSLHLLDRKKIDDLLKKHWQHLPGYDKIERTVLHYLDGKLTIEIYMPLYLIKEKNDEQSLIETYQHAIKNVKEITEIKIYFFTESKPI